MAKKATTNTKLPSSKGREIRIKKCTVPGCNGQPQTKEYTAEPFKGLCCAFCLEVVTVEIIEKPIVIKDIPKDTGTRKVSKNNLDDFDDDGEVPTADNNMVF